MKTILVQVTCIGSSCKVELHRGHETPTATERDNHNENMICEELAKIIEDIVRDSN